MTRHQQRWVVIVKAMKDNILDLAPLDAYAVCAGEEEAEVNVDHRRIVGAQLRPQLLEATQFVQPRLHRFAQLLHRQLALQEGHAQRERLLRPLADHHELGEVTDWKGTLRQQ